MEQMTGKFVRLRGPRMKLLPLLAGGFLILGILYFTLRFSVFPPAGKLSVQTEPGGAQILIDLAAARVSPVLDVTLSPGRHNVTARWDDLQIDTVVTIVAGQSTMLVISKGSPPPGDSTGGNGPETPGGPGGTANPEDESRLTLLAFPAGEKLIAVPSFDSPGLFQATFRLKREQ